MSVEAKAAALGAASGIGAGFAIVKEIALEIFGVPLPVVLAAATGALWARATQPQQTFLRALWATVAWTATGAFLAALARYLLGAGLGTVGVTAEIPGAALAGLALLITWLGPKLAPVIAQGAEEILRARLRKLRGDDPEPPK